MCGPSLRLSSWYHLCARLHYLNQFYNSQQSTLRQEVRAHNNGLLNHFSSFSSFFYMSPLRLHNSVLLGREGKLGAGEKRQLSGTRSEREACCFCTADGHLVALPPNFPSPLLVFSLSCSCCGSGLLGPSSAAVLPSNGGLEQSEQGQSDSGRRLADDLLAGLESSEPRQLKWSLKLEPTCREGGESQLEKENGREGEREPAHGSSMETDRQTG